MHLLVILLQQLLGMLPSKQPVPQAEVVRPRSNEPRNNDPASFAGYELAWGSWNRLPMPDAPRIRTPIVGKFEQWRKPGPGNSSHTAEQPLSPGESPGES